ncbi:hypothetical protein B0T14DRAFT_582727 [Immersiella caudata]|uniref:J domain-containing protein n=1 Tax=Immersiella caudata TaxID=314043 RepID=A0AA39WYQ0_9PEZI|nr:hypothetical protein B0T14DRAFT_582727 [Immersiella caudata]
MAPVQVTDDYYAVLEINQDAKIDVIKANYKRLARARHPDKNPGNPNATAEFQLLQAAYSTLNDEAQRSDYDRYYRYIPKTKPQPRPTPAPQKPPSSTPPQPPSSTDLAEIEALKTLASTLDKSIFDLQGKKAQEDSLRIDTMRALTKCAAALERMRLEALKDAQEEAARSGWFAYIYATAETEERKEARQRRATERNTGKMVREAEEKKLRVRMEGIQARISGFEERIAQMRKQKREEEIRKREAEREEIMKRNEARKREEARREDRKKREEEEHGERWRRYYEEICRQEEEKEKCRAEGVRREAEKKRAEEVRREMEMRDLKIQQAILEADRLRREAAEESARKAAEESARKAAEESAAKGAEPRETNGAPRQPAERSRESNQDCEHKGWWEKEADCQVCPQCHRYNKWATFRCRDCDVRACPKCRDVLRGSGTGDS